MTTVCTMTASAHYYNNVRVGDNAPIYCMAQDYSDVIWLGTGNGLYLYDGYRCIPRHTAGDELRSTIYCMKSDGKFLYLGTPRGLLIYDSQEDHYIKPKQEISEARTLVLADNNLLIGSPEGLWSYYSGSGIMSLKDNNAKNIYSLLNVGNLLFIGTLKGLYIRKNDVSQLVEIRKGNEPFINSLLEDPQRHCVWIGAGDMLCRYDLNTNQISDTPALTGASVKSMTLAQDGALYVATDNGLYTYQNDVWSLDNHDARHPHTLADNVVWSAFIDRWNNVILGTDGGLSFIPKTSYYRYQPIDELTGMGDGNKLATLLIDKQGRKWLGGSNGLILQSNSTTWFRQKDSHFPISHNRIRKVFQDHDGYVWIATDNGINLYDEQSGKMSQKIVTDKTGNYSARWIYDIIEDNQGRFWIATYGGLYIIDRSRLMENTGFIIADHYLNEKDLSSPWIRQLVIDSQDNIWARTGGGLACIDNNTYAVRHIEKKAAGFIISDRQGRIWEANKDSLICYSPEEKENAISLGYNQPTEAVGLCEIDDQIWVITDKECIQTDGNKLNLRLRIPVVEAYGTYYSEDEGCLYIGGTDGLISMYPVEINANKVNRKLMLTNLLVNDRQQLYNGHSIRLPHNENSIELWLSDLPYTGDVSVSYAYQLSGIDDTWHLMSSVNEPLVYSSLPVGNYTLRIRTVDHVGQQGDEVFLTEICILPPWYWSWWAKIIYALILLGFLFWLNRFYRVRKQLAREKREKQRILDQSKMRMDFYSNMSRSMKGALRQVMAPLSEMNASSKSSEQNPVISAIRSQTSQMNALIRQAFDIGGITEHDHEMQQSRINVARFINESFEGMDAVMKTKMISMSMMTDCKDILMQTDVLRLDSIFSILIQNMVKHTCYNGQISVSLNTISYPGKVLISINSDSMKVQESQLPYLFLRYGQQTKETDDDLYLVKEYVEELGGKIRVECVDLRGTTFTMSFDIMTDAPAMKPSVIQEEVSQEEASPENVISEKDEKLMREITAVIEDHLIDSDFNVAMLQETVGIGQKLLYRKVKQITGVTPVEYIRNIRMEKAARLLKEGRFSISEVMYMVGFTKSGYFSKCFQEAFGMTPSAYIKKTNH